ncbi:hypothetical protein L7F22_011338 [Adiantum nelumboides]|nr:hypothetical protein [Adiantum nelumboides]
MAASQPLSELIQHACASSSCQLDTRIPALDPHYMRKLLDGHDTEKRDAIYNLIASSELFQFKNGLVVPDCNKTMEEHREMTLKRIKFLLRKGVFQGYLTSNNPDLYLTRAAVYESLGNFDHSLSVKVSLQFNLWGGAIQFLGTKRHHDKWLKDTEEYFVRGCFAMSELGHGSNVRGIETVATYDVSRQEFILNTPSESAQKYWIGGAANDATHAVVFSQLYVDGKHQGVHAFIVAIRDRQGIVAPRVRIADCGHKVGLNGVDNGRLWFDKVCVPRENLLNAVADVSPDGRYISKFSDPDKRFAAFMAPLTGGRVTICISSIYKAKLGLSIAIRYTLSCQASIIGLDGSTCLLDHASYQHRLLPLLAKTYAVSFAGKELKYLYAKRTTANIKDIHLLSSGYKALFTWHNIRTLQECGAVCGFQSQLSENRLGQLMGEFDSQSTFEGDNTILLQQVSKSLLLEYQSSLRKRKPVEGPGLEHLNGPTPIVGSSCQSCFLQDRYFQVSVFRLRERDLLHQLAMKIAQRTSEGSSLNDALSLSYRTIKDLGIAFSERCVLDSLIRAGENELLLPVKLHLGLLRSLYALSCIKENPVFLR